MKKILLSLVLVSAAVSLSAQPESHFRQNSHRLNKIEQMASKSGYTNKLVSFRTDDNYEFQYFSYDANNRLVAAKDSVRGEYSVIDSVFYNDQGQLVRLSGWQLFGTVFKNVYYIDYTYDAAGNIASRTNYNFFDNEWCLGGIYNYTYNNDHQITQSTLTMSGRLFQRVEYSYTDGLLAQEIWYDFDGFDLSASEKIVYNYENGLLTLENDSISDNGATWEYYGRRTYVYDSYGNCTEYHYYDHTRGEAERSIYTYDYSMPLSQTLMPWNPEMVRPRTYTNTHAYTTEASYAVDVNHVLQYVCDFLYEYDACLGIESPNTKSFSVSPNPATESVTIQGLPSTPATLQVLDLMGRQVLTQHVSAQNNTVTLSTLPSGCYLFRISTPETLRTLKVVVK